MEEDEEQLGWPDVITLLLICFSPVVVDELYEGDGNIKDDDDSFVSQEVAPILMRRHEML